MTPTDTILDTIHMQLENAEEEYRLHGERALYATVPECAAYLLGLLKSDGFDVLVDAGFFPVKDRIPDWKENETCCENEDRDMNGWCRSCGCPCY